MKHLLLFSLVLGFSVAYPSSSEQLELLIDQVYPDISTYLTRDQIRTLFEELSVVVHKARTLEEIAKAMSKPIINTLTPEQKSECWESIQKAQKGFGGFQQLKVIFFHSMDAVQEFMGDSMEKDRAEVVGKSSGITEDEKLTLIYEVFRQYFNIEFGQKVMDTVKYSMTERDWLIATADAAQYLKVENFNLVY
ncbi:hypothetical protein GCK72_005398 [Caenorhabditis remanei]|uniref:SXP/RAL-2 family protein Ani s 5-like cation-binding domain-containing protein n=1 Tax=Caenorhabditis remanei TaxID=31234 RepID=A0A6A5HFG5_CAERE|nr:hypothetical protein GCK72_005398 [Caenorhabditis remanei]KAF1765446.1 hypothetical protein GCK72_005398 [Caenorhabditis remanei]